MFRIFQFYNIECSSGVKWGCRQGTRSLLVHSKPLDCQQFCGYSISFCPNSHWYLSQCTPDFSKNTSYMSTCTNLFLPLWAAVERGDSSKGHRAQASCEDSRRQENWGNIFWNTPALWVITYASLWQCSACIQSIFLLPCQLSFKS